MKPADRAKLTTVLREHVAKVAEDLRAKMRADAAVRDRAKKLHAVLKSAGVKGKVDGQASLTFLSGLLQLLRQSGYGGLVVVLDEVETILFGTATRVPEMFWD